MKFGEKFGENSKKFGEKFGEKEILGLILIEVKTSSKEVKSVSLPGLEGNT